MIFDKELTPKSAFGIALELEMMFAEGDSLKCKSFLIISRKRSISFLCLTWIAVTAVAIADVIALVIYY